MTGLCWVAGPSLAGTVLRRREADVQGSTAAVHDLRHTFASIMIGLSSTAPAHVKGHRDATTTERK